jgi:hypothetical protein
MSQAKEVSRVIRELSEVNEHLYQLVNQIKSYDKDWFESSCDKPIVFGLMGHKEFVDNKIHELKYLLMPNNKGNE